ncbi:C-C chemokine receptor type 4-like [Acipenser ruthenus]|uniref:C-C chemokine receptor type 4-like n=1 Tax=Acipenser ruthenus TaxID=7906 RepID=UPI002741CBB9|nr:C-C chemokine receptor type 4-like [Acipenser ruthenus]XP_058878268.1 C-C chemokine receptor type 4-like [Acipenser ruthenus]
MEYNYNDSEEFDYNSLSEYVPCIKDNIGSTFLPTVYSLLFVTGLMGNTLVFWVLIKCVKLRSMTDVSLLNLAVSDLLFVFSLPFLACYAKDQWIFGGVMCKIILGCYSIGFYSGIFFVTLMSIDRYLAIVHAVYALRTRTVKYGTIASIVVWLVSLLVSFPEIIYNQKIDDNISTCRPKYPDSNIKPLTAVHIFKMNVLGLLIPLGIIVFCYSCIIKRLLSCRSVKKQTIKLVFLVVVVFFFFWTPYNIVSFLHALRVFHVFDDCETDKRLDLSLQVTESIAYVHSCLNPFIYVFAGEKFKKHLSRLLLRFIDCKALRDLEPTTSSVYSRSTSIVQHSSSKYN